MQILHMTCLTAQVMKTFQVSIDLKERIVFHYFIKP